MRFSVDDQLGTRVRVYERQRGGELCVILNNLNTDRQRKRLMSESDRTIHLNVLAATPATLKEALKGVPKKLLMWTPGPGKWSILEIVAHMRDMEEKAYLARYRAILSEANPELPDIDGDVLALTENYREKRLSVLLREFAQHRRDVLKLLRTVKDTRWERQGIHETAGVLSMEELLRRHAVGNDQAHLGQIEAIKERATLFETLEGTPRSLTRLINALDDAALRRKPAPDKWSALEVAAHLRDVERLWADRLVKSAFSERPALYLVDVDALARDQQYNTQRPAEVLREFARLREDNLRLLRALPAAQWKRTAVHPKRGELTIADMANVMASHDTSHLDQARRAAGG